VVMLPVEPDVWSTTKGRSGHSFNKVLNAKMGTCSWSSQWRCGSICKILISFAAKAVEKGSGNGKDCAIRRTLHSVASNSLSCAAMELRGETRKAYSV
jgi:hypothetical protein